MISLHHKMFGCSLMLSFQFNWSYMKKFITGIVLLSFPLFACTELTITAEFLVGQSNNKVNSSLQTKVSEKKDNSSLRSDSIAFRIGVNLTDNFSFELAKHDHGEVVNNFTISIPTMATPSPIDSSVLSP